MSGLPTATYSAPGVPLWAPAGGGGGSVGPNPAFSSITVATGAIYCPSTNISLISPAVNMSTLSTGAVYLENINSAGQYPYRLRANSGSVLLETGGGAPGDMSLSSITVSSINGIEYPPPASALSTFSTITSQVANLSSINCLGGGNTLTVTGNVQTTAGIFIGNHEGSNALFSNVTVSTINNAAYPAYSPPAVVSLAYSQALSVPSQNISGATPLSTLSTLSQSFTFTDFWTYTGPITAQLQFNGSGNTNDFTRANGSDEALFNKAFTFTPQGGNPLVVIVSQDEEGGPLTGSFGPSTQNQPLNTILQSYPGQLRGSFDIKNPAPGGPAKGQYYTGPGVEANITFYGPGTVVVQDTIDFQLSSGDPGATYEFIWYSPVNSSFTGVQPACISYR